MNIIEELLESKLTSKIRKGAVLLKKTPSPYFENLVYNALERELFKNKSWATITELIYAAGICNYRKVLPLITPIVDKNEEFDMITGASGTSYYRLTRNDLHDAQPLKRKMHICKHSLGDGLLDAVGYDKMVFTIEDQIEIITSFWDFGVDRPQGHSDPRYGLVAACAGWDIAISTPFLKHCIETGDTPVIYVAENSLKQRYVRLR